MSKLTYLFLCVLEDKGTIDNFYSNECFEEVKHVHCAATKYTIFILWSAKAEAKQTTLSSPEGWY